MKIRITLILLAIVALVAASAQAKVPRKKASAYDMGVQAYEQQHYEQAVAYMDQALEANSSNGFALAYKGSALRLLDRLDEAVSELGRATALVDDANKAFRAWAYSERFFALLEKGDTAQALTDIGHALADNDREPTYWQNRAIVHGRLGQFQQALSDYDRALALSPDDAEMRHDREQVVKSMEYFAQRDNGPADSEMTYYYLADGDQSVMMPEFPGGMKALTSYLNAKTGWNNTLPPVRVMVDVLIDERGDVAKATIQRGYDKKLDKKALDICRKLPRFAPATDGGVPVACTITLPVRFAEPKTKNK